MLWFKRMLIRMKFSKEERKMLKFVAPTSPVIDELGCVRWGFPLKMSANDSNKS